jgi:hypothetical protein
MKLLLLSIIFFTKLNGMIFYVNEQERSSCFSKIYKYRFYNDEGSLGYVEKSWRTPFIHYPLLGRSPFFLYEDVYVASGFSKIDSIKTFIAGQRYEDIKFYDKNSRLIGSVDAEVTLLNRNFKYTIYDQEHNELALAEHQPNSGIVTLDDKKGIPIAMFTALYERGQGELGVHWKVNLFKINVLDLRVLKIFTAYIINTLKHDKIEIIEDSQSAPE